MKNRKIFLGSLLATFILLSVPLTTTVTANSSGILDKMTDMANSLAEDEDFLALLEDEDVKEFVDLADVQEKDDLFFSQLEDLIDIIVDKEEFKNLVARYESDINFINVVINEEADGNFPDVSDNVYFQIANDGNNIEIEKVEEMNYDVSGISFRSSDDSLYINGVGWLSGSILQKMLDFFTVLRNVFEALTAVPLFIAMILIWTVEMLDTCGFELGDEFYEIIGPIIMAIEIVAAMFMVPFMISLYVCKILEWFIDKFTNAKNKIVTYPRITRFIERLVDQFPLLKLLFARPSLAI